MLAREMPESMIEQYEADMLRQFKMIAVSKADIPLMAGIAAAFDAARLIPGVNLPTGNQWMENYWTVFGPLLVRPKTMPTDPLARVKIMAHECQHGDQFYSGSPELAQVDGHVSWAWLYLTAPEARWRLELWAIRAEMEVHFGATGEFPEMAEVSRMIEGGYALSKEYRPVHEAAIKSFAAQLANDGQLLTSAGKAACQWLKAHDVQLLGKVKV